MNLLLRQIWTLIRKNILIICVRRPITTIIRALIIPLAIVLILSYSKYFWVSPQHFGLSSPYLIRELEQGLSASSNHDIVGFVDNRMYGGAIDKVIENVSGIVRSTGKSPQRFNDKKALEDACISEGLSNSPCYGAIIFYSSPNEPAAGGKWNYTLYGDRKITSNVDVTVDTNGEQVYTLPLQRAVDESIRSLSGSQEVLDKANNMLFTEKTEAERLQDSSSSYLLFCIYLFGAIFSFAMVGLVYHLTAFVAYEREIGMSSLIDTMIPGSSPFKARLARMTSTYISFALIYCPSWIIVGLVMDSVSFPKTSNGLPVGYHIFSGLAFCSFSLFWSSFYKRAQLSGAITLVITIVFAFLPQILRSQSQGFVTILSLIFPSANYTYFITGLARWEAAGVSVNMTGHAPGDESWRVKLYIHWLFLVIQIFAYFSLALLVEHLNFGTASRGRVFTKPADSNSPSITLTNFCKTYRPGFFSRFFRKSKDVQAVVDLSLTAYRGEILCFLGPNGSGKSTTMSAIAGQSKVTSGQIDIDPTGGLGYAPQGNVLWDDLTVAEHLQIFSNLKCMTATNEEVVTNLTKECDLEPKMSFKSEALSGGQKRKLQLAMMFAGGSAVCCVDEVSTGLDPISRRKVWDILLAERSNRTIILTTHFLDEADFLADNIAIVFQGSLKAEGTSVALKSKFGDGYSVGLPASAKFELPPSFPAEKDASRHTLRYRVPTAGLAVDLITLLQRSGIRDYQVTGPTMEELFLKLTGDTIDLRRSSAADGDATALLEDAHYGYELTDGRPLSAMKQWWILLEKRFKILKRRFAPYLFVFTIAIAGSAMASLLVKDYKQMIQCPTLDDIRVVDNTISDLASQNGERWVIGPSNVASDTKLSEISSIYGNVTDLEKSSTFIDSFEEFQKYCTEHHDTLAGGIWLSNPPTVAFHNSSSSVVAFNMMSNMLGDVDISTGYSEFPYDQNPEVLESKNIQFLLVFGLIFTAYPAFFALYPTTERLLGVRSMQYSNGVRPLPLWFSHLCFDGLMILIISALCIAFLSLATPVWYSPGILFIVLLLYGIVSTLIAYLISMFVRAAVAAWGFTVMSQFVCYFAYFGGLVGLLSSTAYKDMEGTYNILYFTLALISPAVSLLRAISIGLGQFGLLCHGHGAGSIGLYGGPILYLVIQGVFLFALLVWWDSGFSIPSLLSRQRKTNDPESTELYNADVMKELSRMHADSMPLCIETVSKRFGKNVAVDNVTLGVRVSEIFALLGPNGAGKSTLISMIRGEMKPSTPESNITIAGHSILDSTVSARANLGVCPQFDAADDMTVTETLQFFAKIRGVQNVKHNVSTVLSACGLQPWAKRSSLKLSGGGKRKLSLAIALIGNPSVLVLDEPSSALDATAKRNMWRTLQGVGKGRAVVLTTHSMEEADALADRIGIVQSRMLAVGDREELKQRAGDAYHVHAVFKSAPRTSPNEFQVMMDWIVRTFEGEAKVSREMQGGQVRFEVPAQGHELVELIRVMETCKEWLGIEFYSVGKATLDDVFENIVRRYGQGDVES